MSAGNMPTRQLIRNADYPNDQSHFCGIDHQKSNFSLISGTLSVGGH